ncbi:MAG TPA: thioredoxin [Myxococcota bacterium]|jgi:thioredoxin 1|nr:thioredoxin [Myxococcota bacterium]
MSEHVTEFNSDSWKSEVEQFKGTVLVDFWAVWCAPCRMIAPIVEEIAKDYKGRLKVGKVNVDDHQDLAQRYNIRSIPTLLLFKDGQVAQTVIGAVPKARLQQAVESVVS